MRGLQLRNVEGGHEILWEYPLSGSSKRQLVFTSVSGSEGKVRTLIARDAYFSGASQTFLPGKNGDPTIPELETLGTLAAEQLPSTVSAEVINFAANSLRTAATNLRANIRHSD